MSLNLRLVFIPAETSGGLYMSLNLRLVFTPAETSGGFRKLYGNVTAFKYF